MYGRKRGNIMEKVKSSECAIGMLKYYIDLEEQKDNFEKSEMEEMTFNALNFIKMPIYRQTHDFTCGVACVQSALRYAGYDLDTREDKLLKRLGSTPENGTNRMNIEEFLNSVTYQGDNVFDNVKWKTFGSGQDASEITPFNELWKTLSGKFPKPVICIIQAWKDSGYDYSEDRNDDGHYVIAVGTAINSDGKRCIIFMDPSTAGRYAYIVEDEFMTRWHDADGNGVIRYCGLILNYKNKPKSEESTFYKLG